MKCFINSGHCIGIDSGAVNDNIGITEAEIVHDIGLMLQEELNNRGYDTQWEQSDNLCGEDGYEWENSVCYHANEYSADIFISLHTNACNGIAKGTEVWYCSSEGEKIAQNIQTNLVTCLNTVDRGIKYDTRSLMVLKHTDMPACLVEIAFIDENNDCEIMLDNKEQIAIAIADAIDQYAND